MQLILGALQPRWPALRRKWALLGAPLPRQCYDMNSSNSTYQRSIRLAESLESRQDNDLDLRVLDLVSSHTYQIFYLTYVCF